MSGCRWTDIVGVLPSSDTLTTRSGDDLTNLRRHTAEPTRWLVAVAVVGGGSSGPQLSLSSLMWRSDVGIEVGGSGASHIAAEDEAGGSWKG